MNETETPIIETETPAPTGRYAPEDASGTFASGEEETPIPTGRYAAHDASGSFASGEEQTPERDAAERLHSTGSFASGEEETPEKDAEERLNPGTFADNAEANA